MHQAHSSPRHDISKWTPDDVWNWLSKQEFANELQVAHFRLINGELLQRLNKETLDQHFNNNQLISGKIIAAIQGLSEQTLIANVTGYFSDLMSFHYKIIVE